MSEEVVTRRSEGMEAVTREWQEQVVHSYRRAATEAGLMTRELAWVMANL